VGPFRLAANGTAWAAGDRRDERQKRTKVMARDAQAAQRHARREAAGDWRPSSLAADDP